MFADTDLRVRLLGARTENDFKRLLWEQMKELAEEQQDSSGSRGRKLSEDSADEKPDESSPTPVSTSSQCTLVTLLSNTFSVLVGCLLATTEVGRTRKRGNCECIET